MKRLLLWLVAGFLVVTQAFALQPEERLEDPVLESRARGLSAELRCVVCQNQSIDESNADIARDMRRVVRERLVEGDTDEQVMQFLVDRYGDYVLLRPPVSAKTIALWVAPAVLIVLGGLSLFLFARARPATAPAAPLTEAERKNLARLLQGQNSKNVD